MKIGRAVNAKMRAADLQIGNWRELKIRAVLDEPDEVESYCHRLLEPYAIRGEWFRTDHLVPLLVLACAQAGMVCPEGVAWGRAGNKENVLAFPKRHGSRETEMPREKMLRWLREYCLDHGVADVPVIPIQRTGPIRDRERYWEVMCELTQRGEIEPVSVGRKKFVRVKDAPVGTPKKQRWDRVAYNTYQREYMRKRRAGV